MLFLIALSALMAAMLCYGRLGGPGLSPCMYPQYDNFKEENMKRTLAIVLSLVLAFGAFSLTQATEPQTYTFVVAQLRPKLEKQAFWFPSLCRISPLSRLKLNMIRNTYLCWI